jgi:hypothetical protein
MRLRFLSLLLCFSCLALAQSGPQAPATSDTKRPPIHRYGIYASWKEFSENKPSVTDSFEVEPYYIVREWENDPQGRIDSLRSGFQFLMTGVVNPPKKVWGIYDGKQLYLAQADEMRKIIGPKDGLMPVDGDGRYPFFFRDMPNTIPIPFMFLQTSSTIFVGLLNVPISSNTRITFYDKKGMMVTATRHTMQVLLREDADLLAAFKSEKNYGVPIFHKYLQLMNERHP